MEEGTEDKEVYNRGDRISSNGVDDIPDHGDGENNTKDMGPIRYLGRLKGMTVSVSKLTDVLTIGPTVS